MTARILLNYVYYSPVGHAVEALRYASGLHAANPGYEIHVALSGRSAWELCDGCPWITRAYPIPLGGSVPGGTAVAGLPMPAEWDYIVDNNLMYLEAYSPGQLDRPDGYVPPPLGEEEQAILAYYARTEAELVARRGRGVLCPRISLPDGLAYRPGMHVSLEIPAHSRVFAERYAHAGPRICVLPAGSGAPRMYPDADTWIAILQAVRKRFPAARIYLTGSRASARGETTTAAYTPEEVARIAGSDDEITDCYDIGLWNQVALMRQCDLLLSPHTGFAFLALCVGTPWLALSGGNWPEYFFNDVPFYSLLPDNPDYPYVGAIDGTQDGPRIRCMRPQSLLPRIPEILSAAEFLLDPRCTDAEAQRRRRENIGRARVRRDCIPTESSF
jgi:hypothetical protein